MNNLSEQIKQFLSYLEVERGLSTKTIKAYKYDLYKFSVFLSQYKKINVEQIIKQDIRDFLLHLAENGNKKPNLAVTRARKLSAIKSMFKFLTKESVIKINPAVDIETPKIPQKEPCYLTEHEYKKLIQVIKEIATPYYKLRDLTIVSLFLATGIRLSELVDLKKENVNVRDGLIKVTRKGNKEQSIPLTPDVADLLSMYLEQRPENNTSCVFISRKNNGIKSNTVYCLIIKYLKKAGIYKEKLAVHSLRHACLTNLLNKGVNPVVVQELAGHKNLETTRRYLHINSSDVRAAVNLIKL